MSLQQRENETKCRRLDDQIHEVEERRDRGDLTAAEQLRELRSKKDNQNKEQRRAADRDYLQRRGRDREMRSKFEKALDALRGDL